MTCRSGCTRCSISSLKRNAQTGVRQACQKGSRRWPENHVLEYHTPPTTGIVQIQQPGRGIVSHLTFGSLPRAPLVAGSLQVKTVQRRTENLVQRRPKWSDYNNTCQSCRRPSSIVLFEIPVAVERTVSASFGQSVRTPSNLREPPYTTHDQSKVLIGLSPGDTILCVSDCS
mgnify:FL=1